MAFSTLILISSNSLLVANLFSYPIVLILKVAAPIKEAIFVETPLLTRESIDLENDIYSFLPGIPFGPGEVPSPKISKVTPCLRSLRDRPSFKSELYPQLNILINPGDTAFPSALIIFFPLRLLLPK